MLEKYKKIEIHGDYFGKEVDPKNEF